MPAGTEAFTLDVTSVVDCDRAVDFGAIQSGVTYIVVGRYTVWIDPLDAEAEAEESTVGAATTATCGSKRTEFGYIMELVVVDSVCVTVTLCVMVVSATVEVELLVIDDVVSATKLAVVADNSWVVVSDTIF